MLMPAGVLVVLLLASLALDTAVIFLGQRELANAAAAAAGDVAATAIDEGTFYDAGVVRLDSRRAREIVAEHVRSAHDPPLDSVEVELLVVRGRHVELRLRGQVRPLIGLLGRGAGSDVRATAIVSAEG